MLSFRTASGALRDVEHATDDEFQAFIVAAGIPVDAAGIAEWSFDDRCGIINHALKYGATLPFITPGEETTVQADEPASPAKSADDPWLAMLKAEHN